MYKMKLQYLYFMHIKYNFMHIIPVVVETSLYKMYKMKLQYLYFMHKFKLFEICKQTQILTIVSC